MKSAGSLSLIDVKGYASLAAFLDPEGGLSSLDGCIAKMASISYGDKTAEVLVLMPEVECWSSSLKDYDWVNRWNRLHVEYAPWYSKDRVKASECVERKLAEVLKKHLEHANTSLANTSLANTSLANTSLANTSLANTSLADTSLADTSWEDTSEIEMVLQESFGNRLALISADEESVRTVVGGELKVTRLRDLDAEERVRFSSELSKEWKAVIENSRPILDEFDPEDLRPDTRGGTFCKVATAFGVGAVVGGTVASGLLLYFLGPWDFHWFRERWLGITRQGTEGHGVAHNSTLFNTTAISATTSSASFSTILDYDLSLSTATSLSTASLGSNTILATCKPVLLEAPLPDVGDVTTMLPESVLVSLRIPTHDCEQEYEEVIAGKAPIAMVVATMDKWSDLDWSKCSDYGGSIVCAEGDGVNCHHFGTPYKFDFPTVWQGVVRYLKPALCSFQCNNGFVDNGRGFDVNNSRLAKEIAVPILDLDLDRATDEQLDQLGVEVGQWLKLNNTCSYNRDCTPGNCRAQVALPGCTCAWTLFECTVKTPAGNDVNWGRTSDFNSAEERLAPYYTAFKRHDYVVKKCRFQCFQPSSNIKEILSNFWTNSTAQ